MADGVETQYVSVNENRDAVNDIGVTITLTNALKDKGEEGIKMSSQINNLFTEFNLKMLSEGKGDKLDATIKSKQEMVQTYLELHLSGNQDYQDKNALLHNIGSKLGLDKAIIEKSIQISSEPKLASEDQKGVGEVVAIASDRGSKLNQAELDANGKN